ncbi:3-hydroxybutyrate oligomer hydrolase family protein [Chitinimonas naiadis]
MPVQHLKPITALLMLGLPFALCACGGNDDVTPTPPPLNAKPSWLGSVSNASYDGGSNDLLTAGLGKTGMGGAAPTYADPTKPTAAELRKVAIYTNYRALIDVTVTGGYGRLYGPNIDTSGNDTLGEGKIAGEEYIAFGDDAGGAQNVTLMVQIPASFNKAKPCVVSAVSSGSRGVYGAIGTAGDWGLKHGCAVAYADKGSGMGYHDLAADTVNLIDGTRTARKTAGTASTFSAALSDTELAAYNLAFPNRLALKHVHSQQNPEKDWGRDNLRAIQFAFYLLNEKFGSAAPNNAGKYADYALPGKVTVIASSVSNGGGAALQAAEQDTQGYISGVAVGEPQIQPASVVGLTIQQGGVAQPAIGKSLIDYFTAANLYQPCAAQSAQLAGTNSAFGSAVSATLGANRCAALAAKGVISGATLADQSADAYNKLRANGWLAESDSLHAAHFGLATLSVTLAYVNAYGKFSVKDNICGYSYAYSDATGSVVAPAASLANIFGNGNGVPGYAVGGLGIINNLSVGGAKADSLSVSASTAQQDYNVDGALCLRALATGKDPVTGTALTGDLKAQADRVQAGVNQVLASANLRSKPAIIVAGRSDTLIPVNHAARAYFAANQKVEGANSKLRYVEVTNGQHFDSFLGLSGFPTRFIPLHVYFNRAMDAMWSHLTAGASLPASQVVHTTPRVDATANITTANLPAIAAQPQAADAIAYSSGVLSVPN